MLSWLDACSRYSGSLCECCSYNSLWNSVIFQLLKYSFVVETMKRLNRQNMHRGFSTLKKLQNTSWQSNQLEYKHWSGDHNQSLLRDVPKQLLHVYGRNLREYSTIGYFWWESMWYKNCFWLLLLNNICPRSLHIGSMREKLRYKSGNQFTWSHFDSARPFANNVAVLCDTLFISLRAVAQLLTFSNANCTVMSSYRALTMHLQWHWKWHW